MLRSCAKLSNLKRYEHVVPRLKCIAIQLKALLLDEIDI